MRQLRFNILRSFRGRARCVEKNVTSSNLSNTDVRTISEVKGNHLSVKEKRLKIK
jgi:hypothetical protein